MTKQNYKSFGINYKRFSDKPDFFLIHAACKVEPKEIIFLTDEKLKEPILVQVLSVYSIKIDAYKDLIWIPVKTKDLWGNTMTIQETILDKWRFHQNTQTFIGDFYKDLREKYKLQTRISMKMIKVKYL